MTTATGVSVEHFVSKLGTAKGVARSRIWIEGDRLVRAGFTVGLRFNVSVSGGVVTLTVAENGQRKVSGKGSHPIIDITGECVRGWFPESSAVVVTYHSGRITIFGA